MTTTQSAHADVAPGEPLLDWLDRPRADVGLHIANASGWDYTPYPELAARVRSFAAGLAVQGVPTGTVVTLMVSEPEQFIVSFFGCLLAGVTPSPVMPRGLFRKAEGYLDHIAGIFAAAKPGLVVVSAESEEHARAGLAQAGVAAGTTTVAEAVGAGDTGDAGRAGAASGLSPDRLALLQFTSGSSGDPKGVRVPWRGLTSNVVAIKTWLGLTEADSFAGWLPLFHDMGLIGQMIVPITSRMDLWIMTPEQFIRSPKRWLECFGRDGVTITTSPSFGYSYAARRVPAADVAGFDFSRWRVAILGAERIDPGGVADFTDLVGPLGFDPHALVGAYGLAESTLAVTGVRPGDGSALALAESAGAAGAAAAANTAANAAVSGSGQRAAVLRDGVLGRDRGSGEHLVGCGKPLGGMAVRIVDEDGAGVPEGVVGEIVIAGTSLADGYILADGTATDFDPAGHRTGDAGFLDGGELFVIGRIGDCVKVRGAMVFAEDLEAELETLIGVTRGRVAVLLGRSGGADRAVALVESSTPERWEDLVDKVVATLRARTSPDFEVAVLAGRPGAIDRTSSGKPRRRVIWREYLSGELAGWTPAGAAAAQDGGAA